jgi:TolB-like protein/tetratricopeptide (TPR) repeat protein
MRDKGQLLSKSLKMATAEGPEDEHNRLDSWKEIARHLGREVRTVQLWEKLEGLPIHRHFHRISGSVFAFRTELDAWRDSASRMSVNPGPAPDQRGAPVCPSLPPPRLGEVTVAVLPFEGPQRSPDQERFEDGLVSETAIALQRLCPLWLNVISRTAVLECKGRARLIGKLRQAPQTHYVIEGASQIENGRIRVDVSLVNVRDKAPAWSHRYHGKLHNSLQLQSRVANQIAHCVCVTLLSLEKSVHPRYPVANANAWDAYILGRFLWKRRTEESIKRAIQCFRLAVREEPRFGLAHSGLADCFTVLAFFGMLSPEVAKPIAQRAVQKAMEFDPSSAQVHTSLALILFHFDQDWTEAEREFQEAIRCDPGYAFSYHGYAKLLGAKGQHEAARLAMMQAVAIDPSPITLVWLGATAHAARRYEEAIRYYQLALQFDPDFPWAHMYLAQTLEQIGHVPEALAEYERAISLCPGNNPATAMKAYAYAASGDKRTALRIVSDLTEMRGQDCMPSYDIAAVYAALGEYKQTWPWLQRALKERDVKLFTLSQDPRFDVLRHHSEFQTLIERVGLDISPQAKRPA